MGSKPLSTWHKQQKEGFSRWGPVFDKVKNSEKGNADFSLLLDWFASSYLLCFALNLTHLFYVVTVAIC